MTEKNHEIQHILIFRPKFKLKYTANMLLLEILLVIARILQNFGIS
jgi:hypothetical protein